MLEEFAVRILEDHAKFVRFVLSENMFYRLWPKKVGKYKNKKLLTII
jgi:hypothetical protein